MTLVFLLVVSLTPGGLPGFPCGFFDTFLVGIDFFRNLLPERKFHPNSSDISFYCYTPAKDGTIVCVRGYPNGALWDDPNAEVGPPQGNLAETIPAGLIMQEVVEFDNTRMSRDMSDFETIMVGSKVGTYSDGYCNTRCISAGADAVLAGKPAHYDAEGYFTTVTTSPRVGTFQGKRDANGYVRVWINRCTYSRS